MPLPTSQDYGTYRRKGIWFCTVGCCVFTLAFLTISESSLYWLGGVFTIVATGGQREPEPAPTERVPAFPLFFPSPLGFMEALSQSSPPVRGAS